MAPFFLDSNCFNALDMYFPSRFPSFWLQFDQAVAAGFVSSVAEVHKELDRYNPADHVRAWITKNRPIFRDPTEPELGFLTEIFAVPNFMAMVRKKQLLGGTPVADPFLVAAARAFSGTVVTAEVYAPNSAKLPNVCQHFGVACTNFEGMMSAMQWSF